MIRALLILVACLTSACCSMSAEHRAAAARLTARAEQMLPVVAARFGVSASLVAVELACGTLEHNRLGIAYEDRIVLAREAADQSYTDYVLAHEAVHVFLPDDLRILPGAVQEGLADFIAFQIEPAGGEDRIMMLQTILESGARSGWGIAPAEAFELSLEEVGEMADPWRHEFVYALGLALVSRLGLERLTKICREARAAGKTSLPIPLLCEHAGLNATTASSWSIALAIPQTRPGEGGEWTWSGRVGVRSE